MVKRCGGQLRVIEFIPVQRNRGGRCGPYPHGKGRHDGLCVCVAHDIDEYPPRTRLLALLGGGLSGVPADQQFGHYAGEAAHVIEAVPAAQRDVEVQPKAARPSSF